MKKNKLVRILVLVLAVAMLFMSAVPSLSSAFADDTISDLEEKYKELEQEHKELQQAIDKASDKLSNKKEQRKNIKNQINVIQSQIDNIIERIELLDNEISMKEINIVNLQMEIEDNYAKFERRLRATQLSGTATNWELLFGAESFSEFLSAIETIKRIAKADNALITELKLNKEALMQEQTQLENDRSDVQALKAEADEKRKELDSKYAQVQDAIDDLNNQIAQSEKDKQELEKEMAETQAEIDRIYEEAEFEKNYVGGEFLWPSGSFTKITSKYGWRYWSNGSSDFHTGIDIAGTGIYGTNILAANAGKVIYVKTTYVPNKGYGKYLIIDHGGGYSTLYAHCSSISVKVGDVVKRGDVIGKVGSTGNSTGPHIHFEIRVNGKAQDPLLWFPNVK